MQKSHMMQKPRQASQACFGKRILLIDPDEINYELHHFQLKKFKIKLEYTKSLRHALWLIQENPPDLILTEIYFNGHLHYEHLFSLRQEMLTPIIVQSSQSAAHHAENCRIRGAKAYFRKPLQWDEYTKAILYCLENS
ncbi:MAG: hypothetical protein CVU00_10585 [Bacteroidetes bacterium HGW-Bacteroidetes-17]|jgi:CheY-like chemotaxis protein|nr:MAG: hypothetical protein CVU00_10585 [Bacteroidetes bacterium HGW-Bacteroidetes-17]